MTGRQRASIGYSVSEGVAVVRAGGDLDAEAAPGLRLALERAIETRLPLVLVDLNELSFLDSLGLSVLVSARRGLAYDQQMGLANVPTRMQRVLSVAGFESMFTVHHQGAPWCWPGQLPHLAHPPQP